MIPGTPPFPLHAKNENIHIFTNIADKITVRVSNDRFSDTRNAMEALVS